MKLSALHHYLNTSLNTTKIRDYCPNGLQVEGRAEVHTIITGVTACQDLIDAAIEMDADAILVHHGYFWKGEPEPIVGIKKQRIQSLLKHDISLLAYHLPLDMHPTLGNNAQLAEILALSVEGPINPDDSSVPGLIGRLPYAMTASEFADYIARCLGREPQHIGEADDMIETIAWCTGAAESYMHYAINQGIDAYLTGEINEPCVHLARESGTHFYGAGHHATERYGVKALGEHLAQKFALDVHFIDIDNPV